MKARDGRAPGSCRDPGSFRDPSGHVFRLSGTLFRQVNEIYRPHYDRLMESGLYERLIAKGLVLSHVETDAVEPKSPGCYKILKPEAVPFVSYPYEWSFSQLKDAALLTLRIQEIALGFGMSLKDGTAYNVQFAGTRPLFIDTLSFEILREKEPWPAYGQFCRHFLAPLALISLADPHLGGLSRLFLDGAPLDLAARLLPFRARLRLSLMSHLFLHSRFESRAQRRPQASGTPQASSVSQRARLGMLHSLRSAVQGLRWDASGTTWSDYYRETNYSEEAFGDKQAIVGEFLNRIPKEKAVWDLGANVGTFSRLAAEGRSLTVSVDSDPAAVDRNYREARRQKLTNLLPLLVDLSNPTSSAGWDGRERASLFERIESDGAALALALVHHLAIGYNVPMEALPRFFRRFGRTLIVEFVPKEDSQVQRMLALRDDVFPNYDLAGFRNVFQKECAILDERPIRDSSRTLFLMEFR